MGDALNVVRQKGGAALKLLNDFAGPLALASGAALTFAAGLGRSLRNLEQVDRALATIERREFIRGQFRGLLGGLDNAEKKVREIARWSAKSPFRFEDSVAGAKNLQVLTNGALTTKRGLDLAGNAAAATSTGFGEMSGAVGMTYAALRDGKPVEAMVEQLADFGAISRSTAQQVVSLAGSGAAFSTSWSLVEKDLSRNAGAMREVSKELTGLKARLANAQENQSATLGDSFAAGEKIGIEAQIRATEALTPVIRNASQVWGIFWGATQKAKAVVVEFAAKIPGLKAGLVGAAAGVALLVSALATLAIAQTTQLLLVGGRALLGWAAGARLAAGATGLLARTIVLLTGPIGIAIAALSIIVGFFADWYIETNNVANAAADLRRQVDETNQAIKRQIANIQTMGDRAAATQRAYQNLVAAQDALREAEKDQTSRKSNLNPFDDKPAGDKVAAAKEGVSQAEQEYQSALSVSSQTLGYDEERLRLAQERLEIERQVKDEVERTMIDNLSGAAKVAALDQRAQRKDAELREAEGERGNFNSDQAATADAQNRLDAAKAAKQVQREKLTGLGLRDEDVPALSVGTDDPEQQKRVDRARSAASERGQSYLDLFNASVGVTDAQEQQRQARKEINDYTPGSRVFAAQQDLDVATQAARPDASAEDRTAARKRLSGRLRDDAGNTLSDDQITTPLGVSAAQLGLSQARQKMDVNSRLREASSATAEASRAGIEARNQQARDLDSRRQLEGEGALARLPGTGLKGEELARSQEEVRRRDAQRRINMANAREEALKGGDQFQISSLGATGMTLDQVRNDRAGAQNDIAGIESDRKVRQENGGRQKRQAETELRAERLERGGNKEGAERVRDTVKMEERILQLRSEGLKEEEATKLARKEMRSARLSRRNQDSGGEPLTAADWADPANRIKTANWEKAKGAIQSLQVDSMGNIGGNSGGGGGLQDVVRSILEEVRRANREIAPEAPPPKWDDDRRGPPPPMS